MTPELTENFTQPSLFKRGLGLLIDAISYYFGVMPLAFLVAISLYDDTTTEFQKEVIMYICIVVVLILFFLKDMIKGISIGKLLMGIAVKYDDGTMTTPKILNLFKRNLPLLILPVEIYTLFFNEDKRRLGDKFANTIVINDPDSISILQRLLAFLMLVFALITVLYYFSYLMLINAAN